MIRRPPRSTLFPTRPLPISNMTRLATRIHLHLILVALLANSCTGTLDPSAREPPFFFAVVDGQPDRKSTRLNSSHANISYAVFCLKKKKKDNCIEQQRKI